MKIGNLSINKGNCSLVLIKLITEKKILAFNFFIKKSFGYKKEKSYEDCNITTWEFSPLFSLTIYKKY